MKITRKSTLSGITRTLDLPVTQEQIDLWTGGMLIQNAMPDLTPDQREFFITGSTAQEWDEFFREEDDEPIEGSDEAHEQKKEDDAFEGDRLRREDDPLRANERPDW